MTLDLKSSTAHAAWPNARVAATTEAATTATAALPASIFTKKQQWQEKRQH